jgi:outer membrane protein TolC
MSVVPTSRIAAFALLPALSGAPARPTEGPRAPRDPLLASLIQEALAHNPDLRAAEEAAKAARARPDQARALPDPMVSLSYTNDGWSPSLGEMEMTNLGVMWSQDLPFPGKRGLRGRVASLEADQADQQLERVRLSLDAAVRRAYYGLLQARDLLDLAREQGEIWRQIEGVARARYTVGQGAQQDVLRVQVEVTRIGQLEAEQVALAEARLAELNRLLGRPVDATLETPSRLALRPLEEAASEVLAEMTAVSPELKSARLAVERERAALALARKDFLPDFSVQAGYMNRGGLDAMWQAGVGVTLPLARKRRSSAVTAAEATVRAAERRVEAVALQLRYRTQERLAQIKAAERIAELYEKGIVPQDRMSVEAAVASYQAGKVPFVAVLEALSTLYADRTAHLAVLAGHERLRASLEEASLEATTELAVPAAGPRAGPGAGGTVGSAPGSMAMP